MLRIGVGDVEIELVVHLLRITGAEILRRE
jgi:hypothetical protein